MQPNGHYYYYSIVAAWSVMLFALASGTYAQAVKSPKHIGFPEDWSQNHIVFSRDSLALHPDLINREPRIRYRETPRWRGSVKKIVPGRDWNVNLSGRLTADTYPSKFSFDPSAPPSCTSDYVVFGLNNQGTTGGPANLVGFNNLYVNSAGTGYCTGTAPKVLFAYNVTTSAGGHVITSPVLSLDGTKIAFVESFAGGCIFHVLSWGPGQGTLASAAAPTMTSLPLSATSNDTASSPYIDFANDIAYIGTDGGSLYQITGVFQGTPTLGAGWPVLLSNGFHLTSPVLDSNLGVVMVGSANGNLYQIDVSSPTSILTLPVGGGVHHGIAGAPIVDVTNGTTFVVTGDDGASAILLEADTASMTKLSVGRIGEGNFSGSTTDFYEPAFSNAYYNDPTTGAVELCGTGASDTTPWEYVFGFSGRQMLPSPTTSRQLSAVAGDQCSAGWTEFYNPNVGADTITSTSVTSNVLTVTSNNGNLAVGQQVYIQGTAEAFLNGETVTVAALLGPGPTYTGFTASFPAADYSNAADTGTASIPTDFFFFGLTGDCTLLGGTSTTGCVVALANTALGVTSTTATLTGGSSGVVVDNYSTASQAASIYLTGGSVNTAYKFTQSGLN